MRHSILFVLAAALLLPVFTAGALANETLIAAVPKGYKVSDEKKSSAMMTVEMRPDGETRENWTEMVTVLTFRETSDVSPAQYRSRMQLIWDSYCPGGEYATLKEGVEQGYPTLTWLWKCPPNKQTGKPEWSWMKAIQGRDNLYSVQRAFRFEPSAAARAEITSYFDGVRVCDTRLADRPCK